MAKLDWTIPIRRDPVVTLTDGCSRDDGLTAAKLTAMLVEVERLEKKYPPHPLVGTRVLHAHENMIDDARKIADALGDGPLSHRPLVLKSRTVPPGFIVAMDGNKVIGIIGPEARTDGETATQGQEP